MLKNSSLLQGNIQGKYTNKSFWPEILRLSTCMDTCILRLSTCTSNTIPLLRWWLLRKLWNQILSRLNVPRKKSWGLDIFSLRSVFCCQC